jgi:tetratricopeptide (TPR) repeat protein
MKRIFTLLLLSIGLNMSSQSIQVQNMVNYLRNKEYDKAKESADAAVEHESTKGSPKTWMYRGNVYKAIYSDTSKKIRDTDPMAEEKALEAYTNCLSLDKGKDIYKDDVKGPIVMAAAATKRKANNYVYDKDYEKALKCYDLLEKALQFDFDQAMKRNNITKEKLMYDKFEMYGKSGNKTAMKEYADKLIGIGYKEPKIYTDMVKVAMLDKDTASALTYIEKGKAIFEDNNDLITTELNIYLARKKTDVLKDRLNQAIEVSPDNQILYLLLGNLYKATNSFEPAEKAYLKAIELNPDYEPAIYNLGVLYYNSGKDYNDKLANLGLKDPKTKEYETKSNEYFKKALGYFETAYEIPKEKDPNLKKLIRQLALRTGDGEKAAKYK